MKKQKKELSWEDIKAMNAETSRMLKDIAKDRKEMAKTLKETNRTLKETNRTFDERFARTEKALDKTHELIGGISRSNGEFCEEYFINSFKANPTLFGERFDYVIPYLKPHPIITNDEYDLVLHNGTTTALVEMKYKAKSSDVGKMFSKLHSYRTNFPMFKEYKIYLCLASFRFSKYVRLKAAEKGIVLIEQRGDKIEVISENIRAW